MSAHFEGREKLYEHASPERIRSLYQRLTRYSVEVRQQSKVRTFVAAYLGGSDAELASPVDVYTAEWLEALPDSKLIHLRKVCSELFTDAEIGQLWTPPDLHSTTKLIIKAPPNDANVDAWGRDAIGWPEFKKELFERLSGSAYCPALGVVRTGINSEIVNTVEWVMDGRKWIALKYYPKPLLQRVHNAFCRAEKAMKYELARFAETGTGKQ